ncbi:MAG: hypothetical protein COB66_05410 [Coxiella sp. (in: Bacteria)]|nr:MAG: hypothetical protein COB66_05410 [Coxiella sp. (in: g-proteobacteria)]
MKNKLLVSACSTLVLASSMAFAIEKPVVLKEATVNVEKMAQHYGGDKSDWVGKSNWVAEAMPKCLHSVVLTFSVA